ncbi:MAG: hypothetical protein IJT67_02910 [Lachnospiraceae bacterium]|nr:hypothetical protein [Lachnospiraceae bacterium]
MNTLNSFIKSNSKIIVCIVTLLVLLVAYTIYNTRVLKKSNISNEDIYSNELSNLVYEDDYDLINYDIIKKDLDDISNILNEQITLNLENNVETESYITADKIYTEKIDDFTKICDNKLDLKIYDNYVKDLNDFQKEMNFNLDSMKNETLSTYEYTKAKYRYLYKAKEEFLYRSLEKYKEYL